MVMKTVAVHKHLLY